MFFRILGLTQYTNQYEEHISVEKCMTFDIGVMLKYKFSYSHFGYFLVVQDIFSKYIWTFPLKKKDSASLLDAFSELFKKTKRRPKKL
jgi:hypothetical protein